MKNNIVCFNENCLRHNDMLIPRYARCLWHSSYIQSMRVSIVIGARLWNIYFSGSTRWINKVCWPTFRPSSFVHPFVLYMLYNSPSYCRILIGSHPWYVISTKFFLLCFKMAESFQNKDNILCHWAKIRYKNVPSRHWTGTSSRKKSGKSLFF